MTDNELAKFMAYAKRVASEKLATGGDPGRVGTFGGQGRVGWLVAPFQRIEGTSHSDGYQWRSETDLFLGPDGSLFLMKHHWDTASTGSADEIHDAFQSELLAFDNTWKSKQQRSRERTVDSADYYNGRPWSRDDYVGVSKKLSAIRPVGAQRTPETGKPTQATAARAGTAPPQAVGRWARVRLEAPTTIVSLTRAGAAMESQVYEKSSGTPAGSRWVGDGSSVRVELGGASVELVAVTPNEMHNAVLPLAEHWYRLAPDHRKP
jgi:hypothetical protein